MRKVFEDFAREEGHKARLEAMKGGKIMAALPHKVSDLKIADYVVDIEPKSDS